MTKNKNIKNNQCFGGRDNAKNSHFKPLVASSLALALGVSVATATDVATTNPTIQWNNGTNIQSQDFTDASWTTTNNYQQLQQTDGSAVEDIIFTFVPNDTTNTSSTAPVITANGSIPTGGDPLSGYLIQQGGQAGTGNPLLGLTSSSSLMVGANGSGNIYFNFLEYPTTEGTTEKDDNWGDSAKQKTRKMILDLSSATNADYSLYGNVFIDAGRAHKIYGENVFEATFGKGMKGNLTLQANQKNTGYYDLVSKIVFQNGSSITGDVLISAGVDPDTIAKISDNGAPYSGSNLIFRKASSGSVGGIIGTLRTTGGYSRLYYEADNVVVSDKTILDIRQGTLIFDVYKNVLDSSANNPTNINGSTINLLLNDSSSISGGNVIFNGYRQIIFGSNGVGTLTITPKTDGETTYQNGSVKFVIDGATPNNPSIPIVKGNISANSGSVVFTLSDITGKTGSNPFADSNAQPPTETYYVDGNLTINNGGISSFWDDTQGFYGKVAVTDGHKMSITGNLIGKNDAWFESGSFKVGSNTINIIKTTSSTSHLVFEDAMIIGTAGSTPAIQSSGGANMIMFKSSATINNDILTNSRQNSLYFKGDATINGNILSRPGGQGHNNLLVFTGSSATIGSSNNASSIEITNGAGGNRRFSNNTLMFNSTTSTLNLSRIYVVGEWSPSIEAISQRNFNALSFNNGTNNVTIGSISSSFAVNLIAKDFYLADGYNTALFRSDISAIKGDITSEFVKSQYSANGNFTIGSISVGQSAANYLNLTGTTKIIGDITSRLNEVNGTGHNNLLVFTGTSSALGDDEHKNSISVNNTSNPAGGKYSNNTLLLGATTNTLNLSSLSVTGDYGNGAPDKTFNALSFNSTSDNGSSSIGSISATFGFNIIGKNLITQGDENGTNSGYNTALFSKNGSNPSLIGNFFTEFIKSDYAVQGTFVIGDNTSGVVNAITTGQSGNNYLNLTGSTTIKGNILSSVTAQNGTGHNNLLILTGTSATLGENGKAISIGVYNPSGQTGGAKYSNNTLLLGATTNTLNVSSLSVTGDFGNTTPSFNTLSLNSNSNTANIASISAVYGTNIIGKNLITQGDENGTNSGYNTSLFSGNGSNPSLKAGFATEFLKSDYAVQGTFVIGDNASGVVDAITTGQSGNNYLNFKGSTTIKGNILSSVTALNGQGHNNLLVLTGASATLGESGKAISISVSNSTVGGQKYSNNTLLLGATTNTLNVSNISVSGDYGGSIPPSFNALSFNSDGDTGTKNIASMSAGYGFNIIGKNLITQGDVTRTTGGYNASLFNTTNSGSNPSLAGGFFAEFLKSDYAASGTFVFGNDNSSNAFSAGLNGQNYVNINGNATFKGNILSSVSSASSDTGGHNNIIILTGTSATLGESNNAISVKIANTGGSYGYYSTNTLLLGATTNTLNLSELSVSANWVINSNKNKNFNALSFNNASNTGNITSITASYGSNIIGKDLITQNGGYNTTLFADSAMQDAFATSFMSSTYMAQGFLTFDSITSNDNGTNYINVNSFTISTLTANGGSNNIGFGADSKVLGNISKSSGTNNFTYLADSISLTLQGENSVISTLTALSSATTGDTLIIDGTTNANNTTIDTLTNGDKLIVNFNGKGDNKGATLNLGNTPTLKQVIVNDNSTNNTLDLTQTTTTTINTKIAIADTQQLAINLGDTELALAKDSDNLGLTTTGTGISTINVSNTGTLSGGDIVATNLNLNGSSANAILKSANTTFANLTADANGTLTLGEGSANATINSSDSTFNATFSNGSSAQTLAINGGTNTISTLTLGTLTGSITDTLSIGGGSTTITNAITSDTGNNLILQIGSSDSSKSASLTLSDVITTNDTGVANVIFTGSTTASSNLATLTLKGSNNTLTGVTTKTANALIEAGTSTNTSNLGILTFSGTSGTQSLQINGGTNTITSLTLSNANNILTQNAGNTTITNSISVGANQNLTLALTSSSDRLNPSETSVTLSGAITKNSGVANVTFTGGTDNQHYYSDLILTQSGNTLSSVTSNAKNARITMQNTAGATIDTTTIGSNSSLVFGFTGSGASTVTLSGGITVGNGSTLGISLGVSDATTQTISGNIVLQDGSTLLVDFLNDNKGSATLGSLGAITIGKNRNSIINFHGTNSGNLNGRGIEVNGGDNTINFLGSAEISSLTLTSGTNTINLYAPKDGLTPITATIVTNQIGGVSNTINLDDRAILNLKEESGADGSGTLTSSGLANTLNFKGNEATFKGGFGATSTTQGSATINVGSADKEIVSGTITGAISNASLNFNAGTSKLTLQSQTNTFTTINSQAKDGILVLDTATKSNAVNAAISGQTTIASNKSLSFDFKGDQNSTITTTGGLVIDGTLGVIISGSGAKKVEGDINLNGRGTLYVNYAGGNATVTLGDGDGITIGKGESSIIDFNSTSGTLANALTLDGGSNTINFNQNASLDKITLTSGNNTFNVADGKTATIGDTSDVGGVHNTINLGAGSIIDLQNGDSQSGSGSIITSLNNTLNFKGNGATLKGSFGASGNGSARVNVAGSGSVITGSLSNASIAFTSDNADLTLQSGNSTITSLTGFTAPSTYTRNGRTITRTISNTLALDGTTDVSATITSAVVGDSVGLKFGDGSEQKTFTFSASGNHLTGVAFGTTSTNNTLEFTNGNSTLENASVSSGNGLTIELRNANLTLTNGYSGNGGGVANLSVTGNAGIIANNQTINVDTLSFDNTTASSLSVSNSGNNTFASVDATNTGTLIADNSTLTITALTGNNLTAGFSGNSASSIAIQSNSDTGHSKEITLTGIVLNGATSDNTLDLSSLENTTITNNVSVGANQSLAINLGGTSSTLSLSGGLSGNATINAGATSNIIAGSSIALSNLNLNGTGDNTTTLTTNSATINTLNANATTSNKLVLDATSNTSGVSASINSIGSTTRSAGSLDIALNSGNNTTTLSLNGNTINSLDIQGDNNNLVGNAKITSLASANGGALNINGGNVEVTNAIAPTSSHNMSLTLNSGAELTAKQGLDSSNANINLTLNNSTLSLGATSKITSLSGNGGAIDFVSSGKDTSKSLTITDNCNANANVITYVDTSKSEKANLVTVQGTNSTGVLTISAYGDADEIFSITYDATDTNETNVKVASVGNNSIDVKGGTSDIDGEIIQITLTPGAAGDWYIGSAISKGVDTSVQEVVTSALAVNYDLYLANFNSLNKRMGELRNTQESNGVWARVFGGNMSNDFGVGSKTDYITTQAGYDYSLSVGENARNFIGVAIAYGASSTKSNPSSNPNTGVLDNISSSMIEVGLYNSYVADSGWYNDTIFKFDYIMSDFTLKTGSNSQQNSTSNFAMILSDEFGYRYSFGENKKGSWYIDPQAEVAFGYFNQSDFNQALNESATRTIKATQDSILTLRSRVGASLGKKFNTDKGFASVYVGAFYEYDYIEGGKSDYSLISSQGEVSNPLQSLESNGRAILNVGSNIELTKGARLYIDVEKSFGDKQRTFMQFNLGARYSF